MPISFDRHLLSLDESKLKSWLKNLNEPEYRAKQILSWIYSNFNSNPTSWSNIPLPLRQKVAQDFISNTISLENKVLSEDGTEKLLLRLSDNNAIEMAIIKLEDSFSFCLSSQVGCPVRCAFCASGAEGFIRNLSYLEILEEFIFACNEISSLPDNIVFMGIGEPLLNYENLMLAIRKICSRDGFALSPRKITISTSGISAGILKLAQEKMPLNLAISLHAPDDATRSILIPSKLREPISKILSTAETYFKNTGRIVTLEYVLIDGINDSVHAAAELAKIANRIKAKINLIPFNKTDICNFAPPDNCKIELFENELRKHHAKFTRRVRRGASKNAACGQLRISRWKS